MLGTLSKMWPHYPLSVNLPPSEHIKKAERRRLLYCGREENSDLFPGPPPTSHFHSLPGNFSPSLRFRQRPE